LKLKQIYLLWQEFIKHLPKTSRYTLGEKIDDLFIIVLELCLVASKLSPDKKLPYLKRTSLKLDTLQFFLLVVWEAKQMETKHYALLAERLDEVGRMLGGWQRGIQNKTSNR
jgi:hypothetical protein